MRKFIERIINAVKDFTVRNERTLFTTVARVLAFACLVVAAIYAVKLAGQITL